jgi:hypothetical protein
MDVRYFGVTPSLLYVCSYQPNEIACDGKRRSGCDDGTGSRVREEV